MALYKYEGKWYCEAKDLSLSVERLSLYLHRGRKSSESFQNIRNPYYHGRNSKRLVLLASIPERLRRQVEEKFLSHAPRPPLAGEEKKQTRSFSDSAHSKPRTDKETEQPLWHAQPGTEEPTQQSVQSLTHLTSEAVLQSQSALEQALQTHIEATRGDYLEHYLQQGHTYRTALRCAKTCAFVTFLCEQEYLIEVQSTDAKAASLHTQALHANVIQVLSKLDISVPKSSYRYHQWWSNIKQKVATETCYKGEKEALGIHLQEAVPQAVLPKRQCNTNTCKLHAEAQRYIDHVYSQGAALPVRQIYAKLLAHAREQNWWHAQRVFKPPSYRTVALYVSTRQADLVLARKGESAHYTKYLPQIQRSLPTEKNALWGADGTAHNELVFHNGRTRQAVYGIYIFDYASAKLLACAPYLVRRGASERAIYYIEALSAAIKKTQCVPQVLQIDRGPAYTEVKKWCEYRGIQVIPAGAKNARTKLVENLLGRLQTLVVRHRKGWSGQNMTARGRNSHPSPEHLRAHAQTAPTAEDVMYWMVTDQLKIYNEVVLQSFGGQPCGRCPDEIWDTLPSAALTLPETQLALYAGTAHRVTFTKSGLTVYHNRLRYTYFPAVDTEEARQQALALFGQLQPDAPETNKRTLYILDYAKGAYVWTKHWCEGGKSLGFWPLQQTVSMLETLHDTTSDHFKDMRKLQRAQQQRLRTQAETAKYYQPFQKERLQEEEQTQKEQTISDTTPSSVAPAKGGRHGRSKRVSAEKTLTEKTLSAHQKQHFVKKTHPFTGETKWIPKDKNREI